MNKKARFRSIIEYGILLLMIVLTGSARVSTEDSSVLFHFLAILLVLLLSLDVTNYLKSFPKSQKVILLGIVLVLYYIISVLNYSNTFKGLFLRFLWFFLIFCMMSRHFNDAKNIFNKLYNIIFAITLTSIVFFIGINFLHIEPPFRYIEHNGFSQFYKEYFYIFCTSMYYHKSNTFGLSFYRLQSFFWEPGILAIYLNIALAYLTLYREKKSVIQFICFLFCMLFTLSTTGICIASFFTACYIVKNSKIIKNQKALIAIPIFAVASIAGILVWIEKMIRTNVENGSYYIRIRDLIIGAKLIFEKPLLGFGYKHYDRFLELSDQGNSNGIITWGFTMGIIGLVFVFFPFIYVLINTTRKERYSEMVYFGLYVVCNMTEPLLMTPLMLFFLAYEYCKAFNISKIRRKKRGTIKQ